jgi:hypothetical protein
MAGIVIGALTSGIVMTGAIMLGPPVAFAGTVFVVGVAIGVVSGGIAGYGMGMNQPTIGQGMLAAATSWQTYATPIIVTAGWAYGAPFIFTV